MLATFELKVVRWLAWQPGRAALIDQPVDCGDCGKRGGNAPGGNKYATCPMRGNPLYRHRILRDDALLRPVFDLAPGIRAGVAAARTRTEAP
jgi:hypothetical protein